jgi:hypothetical protein
MFIIRANSNGETLAAANRLYGNAIPGEFSLIKLRKGTIPIGFGIL